MKGGMPFQPSILQDDLMLTTIQFSSLLLCWMLVIDGLSGSYLLRYVYVKTVLNISGCRKFAARWVPHTISEVQPWQRYAIAQDLLHQYQRVGDDFLGRIIILSETWAPSCEPHLKQQSKLMEAS
jgi:hypothetical protein